MPKKFDFFNRKIVDEGYTVFAGDCTRQSISFPDYALDGVQTLLKSGQFVSLGSLYDYTKGRGNGWKCPLIKVSACDRDGIISLEKEVGIHRD